jgi:hypothetical protein
VWIGQEGIDLISHIAKREGEMSIAEENDQAVRCAAK